MIGKNGRKYSKKGTKCNKNILKYVCLLQFLLVNIIKVFLNTPLTSTSLAKHFRHCQFLDQLIHFCSQSSTTCMEKSRKYGKTDKTQKITLRHKIHGKWDFDKTEFQRQKTEKLWLQYIFTIRNTLIQFTNLHHINSMLSQNGALTILKDVFCSSFSLIPNWALCQLH